MDGAAGAFSRTACIGVATDFGAADLAGADVGVVAAGDGTAWLFASCFTGAGFAAITLAETAGLSTSAGVSFFGGVGLFAFAGATEIFFTAAACVALAGFGVAERRGAAGRGATAPRPIAAVPADAFIPDTS